MANLIERLYRLGSQVVSSFTTTPGDVIFLVLVIINNFLYIDFQTTRQSHSQSIPLVCEPLQKSISTHQMSFTSTMHERESRFDDLLGDIKCLDPTTLSFFLLLKSLDYLSVSHIRDRNDIHHGSKPARIITE